MDNDDELEPLSLTEEEHDPIVPVETPHVLSPVPGTGTTVGTGTVVEDEGSVGKSRGKSTGSRKPCKGMPAGEYVVNGTVRCGAMKKSGGLCTGQPLPTGRCKLHGGASVSGFDLPQTKHGRYSKYLKGTVADIYTEAINDPELLSLRDELAVLTVRIQTLLEKQSGIEVPPWSVALRALGKLKKEMGKKNPDEELIQAALNQLDEVMTSSLEKFNQHEAIWEEIRQVIQERASVSNTEWKRLNDMQAVITVEQAMGFAKAILDSQREVLKDHPELLREAQSRILFLLPTPPNIKPVEQQ